jgi:hypothetical protein
VERRKLREAEMEVVGQTSKEWNSRVRVVAEAEAVAYLRALSSGRGREEGRRATSLRPGEME